VFQTIIVNCYFILLSNFTGADSTTLGNHHFLDKLNVVYKEPKHGTKILEVTLNPFIYQNQECMCICVRDVSYEMKSEELNEILDYKDKVLRFVSHEFRTPLNCILPILESIKNSIQAPEIAQYIRTCINSTKTLQGFVNDLLDFAQMQARKFKITIIPCKMKKLFEEIIEVMEMQASIRKSKIKLSWDPKIPARFYTDPNRLRQIIYNLVSNALKFTNRGLVTIQTTYVTATICKVSVIDTGIGISKENLKILFQEFSKIQENSHLNLQGVGLGLVISKLLTQELGPDNEGLMVDSEEGKGTTFYFLLESKIDSFDDLIAKNDEMLESLEENDDPMNIIQTTYNKEISSFSPRFKKQKKNFQQIRARSSDQALSSPQKALIIPDLSSPIGNASFMSFSRTENTNLILPPKKKSSDNIILKTKKPPSKTLKNSYGKEIRAGAHRAYTLDDISDSMITSNNVEFEKVIKHIPHKCQCQNSKILVVDDNAFNQTALKVVLKKCGFECQTVVDGEHAIHEVIQNEGCCSRCKNYRIIFMDVEMPNLNGFETTKILRKKMLEGEISFIPIIGVTGYNPQEKRVQCLTSGMLDLVAKPVSPSIIRDLLLKWMGT